MSKAKFVLPDWINKQDWAAFKKMRSKIKKPLSDIAANRAINALKIIRDGGEDPNLALQFAEYQCNRGIFGVPRWYKNMTGVASKAKDPDEQLGNF